MKTDYRKYPMGVKELVPLALIYIGVTAIVSSLFYGSLFPVVLMLPGFIPVKRMAADYKADKRRRRLNLEFKEMLQSLAANMAVGYSLESAIVPVYQELNGIYQGESDIENETILVMKGLELSADVEELLEDFALRSGLDDVREFASMVSVAKSSGGNMIALMRKLAANIDSRMEVEDEIDTMITSKRLEHSIMSVMPFGIVLYLRVCNKGYMDALYGNVVGIAVMTVCLILIILMTMWGKKIMVK
jgi:tight adherence protein B